MVSNLRNSVATWIVTGVCGFLFVIHIALRLIGGSLDKGLDAIAVVLITGALSPFLARIFESLKVAGFEMKFVAAEVKKQSAEISSIQFIISNFLSEYEVAHLTNFADKLPFIVDLQVTSPNFMIEVHHLLEMGFIVRRPGKTYAQLKHDPGSTRDLQSYFQISETGKIYLALRSSTTKPVGQIQP